MELDSNLVCFLVKAEFVGKVGVCAVHLRPLSSSEVGPTDKFLVGLGDALAALVCADEIPGRKMSLNFLVCSTSQSLRL